MANSINDYKYHINIICAAHMEKRKVKNLKIRMAEYLLQCFSEEDLEIGRSIFDARIEAMKNSRYTLIWVTKDDVRGDGWQVFWRQNTLANLIPAHPSPKGCERILVILDNVDEQDFRKSHPEFEHMAIMCTDPGGQWMNIVGDTVRREGVFVRNEEQQPAVQRTRWTESRMVSMVAGNQYNGAPEMTCVDGQPQQQLPQSASAASGNDDDRGVGLELDSAYASEWEVRSNRTTAPSLELSSPLSLRSSISEAEMGQSQQGAYGITPDADQALSLALASLQASGKTEEEQQRFKQCFVEAAQKLNSQHDDQQALPAEQLSSEQTVASSPQGPSVQDTGPQAQLSGTEESHQANPSVQASASNQQASGGESSASVEADDSKSGLYSFVADFSKAVFKTLFDHL